MFVMFFQIRVDGFFLIDEIIPKIKKIFFGSKRFGKLAFFFWEYRCGVRRKSDTIYNSGGDFDSSKNSQTAVWRFQSPKDESVRQAADF